MNGIPVSATSQLMSTDGCGLAEHTRELVTNENTPVAVSNKIDPYVAPALPSLSYVASNLVFMSYQSTRPQRQDAPEPIHGPRSHQLLLTSTVLSSAMSGTDMRGSKVFPSYCQAPHCLFRGLFLSLFDERVY